MKQGLIGKRLIITILSGLCCVLYAPQALADTIQLQVSPPLLHIRAVPPADITTPITITNTSEQGVNLKIAFNLFKDNGRETGEIAYLNDKDPFPGPDAKLFEKIHLIDEKNIALDSLSVGPKQTKHLRLRIILPKNEPAADYYFSAIFLTTPDGTIPNGTDNKKISASSKIEAGIASNVLLSIGPKENNKTYIEEFSSPVYVNSGPVPFSIRVKNTGRHVTTPKGLVLIKNMFGQTVGRIELPPTNVLAGSTRALIDTGQLANSAASTKSLKELTGKPLGQAAHAIWTEHFLLGFYTATLSIAVSDDGPVFTRSIHFLAFPATFLFALLVVILIVLVLYIRVKARVDKEG